MLQMTTKTGKDVKSDTEASTAKTQMKKEAAAKEEALKVVKQVALEESQAKTTAARVQEKNA